MTLNLYAAWIAFLLGILAGAAQGLFFHREQWLGGYGSWRRRLLRLGHISFFGLGLLNMSFALTARSLGITSGLAAPGWLLVVGLATMPLVCYLSAFKEVFRHAFFIPVLSVALGVVLFLRRMLLP